MMTIIRKYNKEKILETNQIVVLSLLELQCDHCENIFDRKYKKRDLKRLHFCSDECRNKSKKNGVMRKKTENTNLNKWGFLSTAQNEEVKQKQFETNRKKYGGNSSMHDPNVVENLKKSMLNKYGVDNPMKLPTVRDKSKKTMLEKYGAEHPMHVSEIKEKIDYKESFKKSHETAKKNNSYAKSKPEDKFYEFLLENIKGKIERQVELNGWYFDFKINNLYVQFDGMYWHGLDRPIEAIMELDGARNNAICRSYGRDRMQDFWCSINNINMIRVLEVDFKNKPTYALERIKLELK